LTEAIQNMMAVTRLIECVELRQAWNTILIQTEIEGDTFGSLQWTPSSRQFLHLV
jgi:hypothetical protein